MRQLPLLLAAALLAACINLQVRDANFRGPTPRLDLAETQKLPLKVAVVIPDPMGVRYYYTPPAQAAGGAQRMDQTDQMRGGTSWAVELARLSGEAFPAAFRYAAVLRQLPAPGEYDAVIELSLTSIDQVIVMQGGLNNELWADWKLSVMNKKNVETFSTTGTSDRQRFNVKASFSAEGMIRGIEEAGGPLMSQIVREAALAVHSHLAKGK